ncbi:MAG TPA: XRE family transcriptional regulator [Rhodopila sp.]|jgi:predicted XRE-type DNA-binding protein|nr:XRE family transcriptional regulator [Rhodopila sp.]
MTAEPIEVVLGSGNIFRDFGLPAPELEHLRVRLAAHIISVLDRRGLSVRQAQAVTGIAAADFSRIRCVRLGRFTVDRLMIALHRQGQSLDVSVTLCRTESALLS